MTTPLNEMSNEDRNAFWNWYIAKLRDMANNSTDPHKKREAKRILEAVLAPSPRRSPDTGPLGTSRGDATREIRGDYEGTTEED